MTAFHTLVFEAVESPQTIDRNALLVAACDFLDRAQAGDDGLPLARNMAAKAMDYAVLGSPAYGALRRAFGLFLSHVQMAQ